MSPGRVTAGRVVLVAALAALLGAALLVPRPARLGVEEATWLLQTASLVADRDLAYEAVDAERFRSRGWSRETRVALEFDVGGNHRFARPLPYSVLAAPFAALAPERGALVLNVLLLALGAFLAVRRLEPRMGDAASWLVATALFGSAVFGYALSVRPESLLVTATIGAFVLAWPRDEEHLQNAELGLPEMYPEPGGAGGSDAPARVAPASAAGWLAGGALVAVVGLHHPLFLLLALPLVGGIPRRFRQVAVPAVLIGLLLVLAGSWLTGTLWLEFLVSPKLAIAGDSLADLAARGPSPAAGIDRQPTWPPPLTDYRLHLSNLTYLAAGRHVGVLVYFLPLLLLLWSGRGMVARGRLSAVMLVVLAALLCLFPFDLAGGGGPGIRWLVPLYAGLLLTAARRPSPGWTALFLLLGGLLMAPAWRGGLPTESEPTSRLLSRLPFETTQREVPVSAEIARRGIRVRAASTAIEPGRDGATMILAPGGRGQLVIGADEPVLVVALELGSEVKGDAEVGGGTIQHEVFRPDGGVTVRIHPRRPRLQSAWWSEERQYVYQVWFSLPETGVAVPFGVSVE